MTEERKLTMKEAERAAPAFSKGTKVSTSTTQHSGRNSCWLESALCAFCVWCDLLIPFSLCSVFGGAEGRQTRGREYKLADFLFEK